MATIRKRGNLQWEARIRRKGWPVTCKTFNTKLDAEKWARDVENDMDRGVFISRTEAERTTLSEALDKDIAEYIPHLAHPHKEELKAKALQRRPLASKFMAGIRSKDIADFIRERQAEGVSGNTVRLDLALLSRLFNVAAISWGMESLTNPVQRVPKPKVNPGRTRRLEKGEEEKLLAACSAPFRRVVCFAVETGMRRTEIADMRWPEVNMERRSVYLPETKNEEKRSVPLSPVALKILGEARAHAMDLRGKVFGFSASALTQAMEAARKKAGLANLNFHDLRHEAISRLFENTDMDIMEIKTITGHKTLQMLARYTHLRTHRLADRLAGAKRGEQPKEKGKRGKREAGV